jgi:hypothetical protein
MPWAYPFAVGRKGMKPQPTDAAVQAAERIRKYVHNFGANHPDLWKEFDQVRAMKSKWPAWCYAPIGITEDIIKDPEAVEGKPGREFISLATALASWRVIQGIYRFDDTLNAIWDTPLTGEVPTEHFRRLPEWCCYIAFDTPRSTIGHEHPLLGFFAYLDFKIEDGKPCAEILMLGDTSDGLMGWIDSNLTGKTLYDCRIDEETRKGAEPLLNVLLYLCAANAEIIGDGKPEHPKEIKTKRGLRLFPPDQPKIWDVGFRIGAAIRAAEKRASSETHEGIHASPRPHIRRAHWHSFWKGHRDQPERELVLHWIPPIPVNVDDQHPVVTTMHTVGSRGAST